VTISIPKRRTAADSTRASTGRFASVDPLVWGYVINPIALAALLLLRHWSLVADEPIWVYPVVLWGGALASTVTEIWFRRRGSTASLHARIFMQAAAVTTTLYVTGWGPVMAVAYAFMAQENVGRSGARTWRITAGYSIAWIALGQLAISAGVAPTMVDEPLVHGIALLNGLALVFVVRMGGAVTLQKEQAERTLRESEDRFRSLVQNSSDLTMVLGTGTITYASEASERLLGYTPDQLVGRAPSDLVHPDDLGWLRDRIAADFASSAVAQPVELRVRRADGNWIHLEAVVANLSDRPSVRGTVVNARDITERKQAEAALEHQALHDSLTGLPNRLLFLDRLDHAMTRAHRDNEAAPSVLFLDLDRFKLVNDGMGHDAGDELLAAVAGRLRSALRPGDTIARFGGDEFVLLIESVIDRARAEEVANRVLACFEEPFRIDGEDLLVSASVGVAMFDPEHTAAELVRDADAAMYRAKAQGRGRMQMFDATTREHELQRVHTENALRNALEHDELRVFYQPIFRLRDLQPVGVEALVRWQHPARGLLPPSEFIDVAEDSGLIVPLGAWVLAESCRQVVEWNRELPVDGPLSLSVNLSARQLGEPGLVDSVATILRDAGIDPAQVDIWLEVTETLVLRDPETAATRLAELQALGVRLAVDDFGTGYSSLSYLRRFPVSALKIDRAFVAGLGHSSEDEAIVVAMVRLAHALGLEVVAEGVESEVQLTRLRDIGCDFAQGFLLQVPLPADQLELRALIRDREMLQPAEHHAFAPHW
jgi:diguanylate cyclase (GGDEF)-like protein/PAS domain S-box-containing protein